MKIFITGGTGFVGKHLTGLLLEQGHHLTIMARGAKPVKNGDNRIEFLSGDGMIPGKWQERVPEHDALINLAGVSVFQRWDDTYKRLLRESRILTTRNLVDAIPEDRGSGISLLSCSGAGIYGFRGDELLTETSKLGDDFLSHLAQDWEAEAIKAESKSVRVARMRFGIVFGRNGGALTQMMLPFKFFVGGPVGNGDQWIPWIHIDDLCNGIVFLLDHPECNGPFNFAAPHPVRNKELAKAIGKVMNRPSFFPVPGFMLKLVLGEFGSVILEGQNAVPKALMDAGYVFRYPKIQEALRDLLT